MIKKLIILQSQVKNKIFDAVFIGSGFSSRNLLKHIQKKNFRILVINSPKCKINKNGIIHKEGNAYINHNIRISAKDFEKLKKLKENNSQNLVLKTNIKDTKKLNLDKYDIKFINIDIENLQIEKSIDKKFILFFNNRSINYETNYLFIGTSFSTLQILKNTKIFNMPFLSTDELKNIKQMNHFSTIFIVPKNRFHFLKLKESNWQNKYAKFTRLKNDIYYHIYLKKFTFKNFRKEWDITFFTSLIKKKYFFLTLLFLIKKPLIIINFLIKIFKKRKYALYISIRTNNDYPSENEIKEVEKNLKHLYNFTEFEKLNLKKALKNFVCNSHYHSNIEVSKYKNIFIIGSSSIKNTFSANPTGIIMEQIKEISKKI